MPAVGTRASPRGAWWLVVGLEAMGGNVVLYRESDERKQRVFCDSVSVTKYDVMVAGANLRQFYALE